MANLSENHCDIYASTPRIGVVWNGVEVWRKSLLPHFHTTTPIGVWGVVWCDSVAHWCGNLGVEFGRQ